MLTYEQPMVELVGKPVMDIGGILAFLDSHGIEWEAFRDRLNQCVDMGDRDGERLIEIAGRTCYMSFGRGRSHEDHVRNLIEVGHGSVLEHVNLNFHFWGVSRSLTHELVRHRAGWAYSQLSQRYVDSSDCAFIVPPAIQELKDLHPDLVDKWYAHCEASQALYEELTAGLSEMYKDLDSKVERRKKARQAARSVLPNATETKVFCTANGRAIRHFVEMRANPAADLEIRMLAVKIFDILSTEFPLLVHGMRKIELPDGTHGVESDYPKV